ncbi:hypothetical protein [Tissierella praeacuta]|uniref:hypothetical protein n=1 Tax=Tissierella praeacuta TaxID=43131 RepID=UPI00333EC923
MKKLIFLLVLMMSFSTIVYADNVGELNSIKDVVIPSEDNGIITTTIIGITNSNGELVIPKYKDAEITNIDVKAGSLTGNFEVVENGSLKYHVVRFKERESNVEFVITQTQENTFELAESKQKGTFPGNVKMVTFNMVNNTPVEIGKYDLEMAIPENYELYNIVGYDPEEPYNIFSIANTKYGAFEFEKLSVGKDVKLSINIIKPNNAFNIILWIAVILISVFFLYKNRDMLKKAKELEEQKKTKISR